MSTLEERIAKKHLDTVTLFENFLTRDEVYVTDSYTMKRVNPKKISFMDNVDHSDKRYFKLMNMITKELNGKIAYSPYAIRTFKENIPRGDVSKIQDELQKLR
jgi:hypothetical protein